MSLTLSEEGKQLSDWTTQCLQRHTGTEVRGSGILEIKKVKICRIKALAVYFYVHKRLLIKKLDTEFSS